MPVKLLKAIVDVFPKNKITIKFSQISKLVEMNKVVGQSCSLSLATFITCLDEIITKWHK
jgi:hypothetical protein